MWWLRIRRDISAVDVPPEERGVPAPHWAPQLGALVPGRRIPTTSGCENQWGFRLGEMEGCWKPRHPPTGPVHRLKSQTFTLSSSKWTAGQKVPGTYREKQNCMALGQGLEGQQLPLFLC